MPSQIETDLRVLVEASFRHYDPADSIAILSFQGKHAIEYCPSNLAISREDSTILKIVCYPASSLAWLSYLQVASEHRGIGLGHALANLAEQIAGHFACPTMRILPLQRAIGFWEYVGYRPEPGTSQILTKECAALQTLCG